MDADDIIQPVRQELGDKQAHSYADEELLRYLTAAMRAFFLKLENLWPDAMAHGSLYEQKTYDITAGTQDYVLPPECWRLLEVFINGYRSNSLSIRETEGGREGYLWLENQLRIFPTADEYSEDALEVYYLEEVPILEATTDDVPMPREYRDALIASVKWQAKARDNDKPSSESQLIDLFTRQLNFQSAQTNSGDRRLHVEHRNWI